MDIKRGLVAVAKVFQSLAILCLVYFGGDALLTIARNPRISDAIADAVPLSLVGALGYTLAWTVALVIGALAREASRP
jgi:hypothetical protein